ncbi:MAG: hypothetical protein FJ125_17115, partial [Deltaproteobacteria bacterium]|nr:hypothetical protein [Deltaproteobacteria bacterium]
MSCTRAARAALGTMAGCWLLAAAPAGLGPAAGEPEVRTLLDWPLIFTQEPPAAAAGGREELRRTGGWAFTPGARGEGARLVRREPDGRLRVLTTGFSWAGEPAVSHDGHRLLFSGRRQPGEPRRIWEMSVEGGEARPVTGA